VNNPVVQQLAEYEGDPEVLNTALRAIFASALLSSGVELTLGLSQQVAYAQMRIIELLLEQAQRIEAGETVGPYTSSKFKEPEKPEPEPSPLPPLPSFDDVERLLEEDSEACDENAPDADDAVEDEASASDSSAEQDDEDNGPLSSLTRLLRRFEE
jgi:hypothetical protein